MKPRMGLVIIPLLVLANLLTVTVGFAHTSGYHWNRYGSTVTINVYNTATYKTEASSAVVDWDTNTILSLPQVAYHTDIHVFDGNYGATGWASLGSLESVSGNHILHAHGRINYYYSTTSTQKRSMFCKLLGQSFGLASSNDGCMNGTLAYTVQHNWDDIYNMYRFSHH
ncbi:MAG TPA: hypothetical protein VFZ66_12580 [Herpetosiphonaceae bacterium]